VASAPDGLVTGAENSSTASFVSFCSSKSFDVQVTNPFFDT
jgi:hypothetical protein